MAAVRRRFSERSGIRSPAAERGGIEPALLVAAAWGSALVLARGAGEYAAWAALAIAGLVAWLALVLLRGRARRLADAEEALTRIIESMARGEAPENVLAEIARLVDSQIQGGRSAVLVVSEDGKSMHTITAPNLPGFSERVKAIQLGPEVGFCGAEGRGHETFLVEDIESDPRGQACREVARQFHIRAFWSMPIEAVSGEVLGRFVVFHRRPHRPPEAEQRVVRRANHLARVALERARITAELQGAMERFRALIEQTSDIVCLLDANGGLRYANPAAQRLLGYNRGEVGDPTEILFSEDLADARRYFAELAARPGFSEPVRYRVRHRNGGWRVLEVIANNQLANRAVNGIIATARDVTDQVQADLALAESEGRYRELFENALDILYTCDLAGRMTSVNRTGERLTGRTRQELLAMNLFDLVDSEYRDAVQQDIATQIGGQAGSAFEVQIHGREGRRMSLEMSTRLLFDGGKPSGVQGAARDVTERRKLEAQLRQAQKMEAVGLLAGGIAHDFNNLLTVITGYTQWMLEELPAGSPLQETASEVLMAADRAGALTRQLLAFSRNQVIEPKLIDLQQLVANLDRMLRRVIGEDIHLVTRTSGALAPVCVDVGQTELVLLNLVLNSRDAMPNGGELVIETANVKLDGEYARRHVGVPPGDYVMLAVSDTGAGMDEWTRARIFEPFFTTKDKGRGTGLGLSTVYGFVRQSGGQICVYSEVGLGSVFKIYFPAAQERMRPAPAPRGPDPSLRGQETILLVEDEHGVRQLVRDMLKRLGYRIMEAADGAAAEHLFREMKPPPDLLLSDVVMPEGGGRALAETLRALQPGLKVLFMSGYTDDAILHYRVIEDGEAFLQKPFTPEALARKVRDVLDGAR